MTILISLSRISSETQLTSARTFSKEDTVAWLSPTLIVYTLGGMVASFLSPVFGAVVKQSRPALVLYAASWQVMVEERRQSGDYSLLHDYLESPNVAPDRHRSLDRGAMLTAK